MDVKEKVDIGDKISGGLLRKVARDLQHAAGTVQSEHANHRTLHRLASGEGAEQLGIKNLERHVRSRFYFTSESHILSLLNVLRHAQSLPGAPAGCGIIIPSAEE